MGERLVFSQCELHTHQPWLTLKCSSTSQLMASLWDASAWSCLLTKFPRPLRTSEHFVPWRKDLATRDAPSIVSSPTSCVRVVTSQTITELEANLSTATSSLMRTSS